MKNTQQGALIPKALSHKRLRKISIEIHRLESAKGGSYEECLVRFLQPANKEVKKAAKAAHKEHHKQQHYNSSHGGPPSRIETTSLASGAIGQPDAAHGADDTSVAGVPSEYRPTPGMDQYFSHDEFEGWEAKYRYPIKCMSIKGTSKTGVFIRVELGHSKHTRELIFDSPTEAEDFVTVVNQELNLEKERGEAKLRLAFSGKEMPKETKEEITFLLEVVSGWNLPAGDIYWSDPYVIVHHGKKEIHRTKYLSRT